LDANWKIPAICTIVELLDFASAETTDTTNSMFAVKIFEVLRKETDGDLRSYR
jgi:hypothetical protein